MSEAAVTDTPPIVARLRGERWGSGDLGEQAADTIEALLAALETDADHFERIERKALRWMNVCANSKIAEARWSEIKRWAGHRGRECRAAIAKARGKVIEKDGE
jgi:dsRNA-specific ribonuclease